MKGGNLCRLKNLHKEEMTIVVKKVPKPFRGIVKFLFKIKE